MSYMVLNGLPIPCAADQVREVDDSLTYEQRMVSGKWYRDQRVTKRAWVAQTIRLPLAEAKRLRRIIEGAGHTWSFTAATGLFSSKGLAGWSGGGFLDLVGTGGPFGVGYVEEGSGSNNVSAQMPPIYTSTWTTAQWVPVAGPAWEHRLQTSTGLKYTDGVATPSAGWDYALSAGIYTVTAGDAIADLVILPYAASADQAASWPLAAPFAPLPRLILTGDILAGDPAPWVQLRNRVDLDLVQGGGASGWEQQAIVRFELAEV